MQQILACGAREVFHQVKYALGVGARGRDEVVRADPSAGGVGVTVVAVLGEGNAEGEVARLRVGVGGEPALFVEVTELARITKAEVHGADLAKAEIGICIVKVALYADAAVEGAGLVELGKLLDDFLGSVARGCQRPFFAVGAKIAGEDESIPNVAVRREDGGALRGCDGLVDLVPVGQLVVAGPPTDIAVLACRGGIGQEFVNRLGNLAAVDGIKNRLVVNGDAGVCGIGKRRDGVDGVGFVLVAGVELVVHLVLFGVHDFEQRRVTIRGCIHDVGEVVHEVFAHPFGDLVGLAPGGEEVRRAARVELGLHTIVKAVRAGVVLERHVDGAFD